MRLKLLWVCTLALRPLGVGWYPSQPRFSAVLPGPLTQVSARLLPVALPQAGLRTQTLGILRLSSPNAHDYPSGRLA